VFLAQVEQTLLNSKHFFHCRETQAVKNDVFCGNGSLFDVLEIKEAFLNN